MKINPKNFRLNRILSLILGSLIICGWTLIRLFNRGPNFDQVGQQVLTHQWIHGLHSGSVIGPTNYVLKMLLLYMPLDMIHLSAQYKLVFITLTINLVTFLLIAFALRQLWLEFYPSVKNAFNLPVIYFSLISGSVYWISFANSRNLEVAAGVFLIYLYLKAQSGPAPRYYIGLIILGGLLFFADPLQIYMTLLPTLMFLSLRCLPNLNRHSIKTLSRVVGCAVLSLLLAHFLKILVEHTWNISFINTKQSVGVTPSSLKSAVEQLAKLYSGGYEGGRVRQAINVSVLLGGIMLAIYCALRKPKARNLPGLVSLFFFVDLGVYILSGQSLQADTNRYLIMTVPMFILLLAVILKHTPRRLSYIFVPVILFNILTLSSAFAKAWNPGFGLNKHDYSTINYFKNHSYKYGYASINTALSSDYLSSGQVNVLPLGCDPDYVLKKTNLFFDKAAFDIENRSNSNLVPIILDGNNITINQTSCGLSQITQQLGVPKKTDYLSDGSLVLFYDAHQLDHLRAVSPTN